MWALEKIWDEGLGFIEVRAAIVKHWGVARSTAEEDIKRARQLLAALFEEQAPYLKAHVAGVYLRSLTRAEQERDYQGVAAIGGKLQRLAGLEAPRKVEVSGGLKLTTAGQRARIGELLERARQRAAERAKDANPRPAES